MEREYDDSLLEKYYNDKTYCKDPSQGIDREGLFSMLCDLNGIPVDDGTFQWSAALVEMEAFDKNWSGDQEANVKWPEDGLAEGWPVDKQIKLQKIYYPKIVG